METRKPVVAGQFYPGQHDDCIEEIIRCIDQCTLPDNLPETIVAGIVPHAGWTFSGPLTAMVFEAIKQQNDVVHTFVIFGAAHGYYGSTPAVYDKGFWATPLGDVPVDIELADALIESGAASGDRSAHAPEHSMEVQVPFIQNIFPGAKILPILSPPTEESIAAGRVVASLIAADDERTIVAIGSTDLTHYGPRYGFAPMGSGKDALKWAHDVNDREFIDAALQLKPDEMLATAAENMNACGAGAAAAVVEVAKELGRSEGLLLAHTNSSEVMLKKMGRESTESVGYAAIVF
jgi:AmmeMemoRadiSam system protein B